MNNLPVQGRRNARAVSWIALGVSILTATTEVWSNSEQANAVYRMVFGYAWFNAFFFAVGLYAIAFVLDLIAIFTSMGGRDRVVAVTALLVLLVPLVIGIVALMAY